VANLQRKVGLPLFFCPVDMVDASNLKSCFVGESEKLVKGLFDQYDAMAKKW